MVLQAVIDDSYRRDGVFVLAGYIARAEAWASFAACWERMLPHGTLNKRNKYHFKMSEMAMNADRLSRVPGFLRVIENHVAYAISVKIDMFDLIRARNRIWVPGLEVDDWGWLQKPFVVAWRCLFDKFHDFVANDPRGMVFRGHPIDFYFDEHGDKKLILDAYEGYLAERPEAVRECYGSTPVFRNDEHFLPLQAADFWAWWVRKWYEDGTPHKIPNCDFGLWKALRKNYHVVVEYEQDHLARVIEHLIRIEIPGLTVYDVTFSD